MKMRATLSNCDKDRDRITVKVDRHAMIGIGILFVNPFELQGIARLLGLPVFKFSAPNISSYPLHHTGQSSRKNDRNGP